MLCRDVIDIVVRYVEQNMLVSYFVSSGLDFDLRFVCDLDVKYDGCVEFLKYFPNMVVRKLCIDGAVDVWGLGIEWRNVRCLRIVSNGFYISRNWSEVLSRCVNLVSFVKVGSVMDFEMVRLLIHGRIRNIVLGGEWIFMHTSMPIIRRSSVRRIVGKHVRLSEKMVRNLSMCLHLRELDVSDSAYLYFDDVVLTCASLCHLRVWGRPYSLTRYSNLSIFRGCVNLRSVVLHRCENLVDVSVLYGLQKLRLVRVIGCGKINIDMLRLGLSRCVVEVIS